jgi:hypothetical protein
MAHNYTLRVTAGSEYDPKTHQIVPVNRDGPPKCRFERPDTGLSSSLCITANPAYPRSDPSFHDHDETATDRSPTLQNYRGLPRGSPSSSTYFILPPHAKNKDAYSISFRFTLKQGINGNDLVFGNDFDHPIRDRLPPGFGTAFKIVKWGMHLLI